MPSTVPKSTPPADARGLEAAVVTARRAVELRALLIARSREDDAAITALVRSLPDGARLTNDAVYGQLEASYQAALNMAERVTNATTRLCSLVRAAERELTS